MKLKLLTTFGIIIFCLNFNAFSQSTDLAGLETRTADAVEWPSDNNLITRPKMGSSEGKDTEGQDKSLAGWFHNLNILSAACNAAQTHTLPVCNNNATAGNTLDDYFSFNVTGTIADGSGNYVVKIGTYTSTSVTSGSSITVTGNGLAGNPTLSANGAATYTVRIEDASNNSCFTEFTVGPVSSCSNCPTPNCGTVVVQKN